MLKRYYIEELDGVEVKRKLTTNHEPEELSEMTLNELLELQYTATAEMLSKARKYKLIEKYTNNLYSSQELNEEQLRAFYQTGENIQETIEEITK